MAYYYSKDTGHPPNPIDVIRSYLGMAIQIGAPSYNLGDHRGCYEVYACTARMLLKAVEGAEEEKEQLREALTRCALASDVNEQAWIMRHTFDAILGEGGE